MDYELIFKYLTSSPMGPVLLFDNIIKLQAEAKGVSFEEELKTFGEFKDKQNRIVDMQFLTDQYEEIK